MEFTRNALMFISLAIAVLSLLVIAISVLKGIIAISMMFREKVRGKSERNT